MNPAFSHHSSVSSSASPSFEPRLRRARLVLFLGLVAFLAAQAMPFTSFSSDFQPAEIAHDTCEIWVNAWDITMKMIRHERALNREDMIALPVLLGVTVLFVAPPFLTGWMFRIRPLLWTVRLCLVLMLAGTGVLIFSVLKRPLDPDYRWDYCSGFWTLAAVPVIHTLGLFLIPKPAPHPVIPAGSSPSIPDP